eukprot:scaffold33172_cov56-Isochrysis_galbana.AAC.1
MWQVEVPAMSPSRASMAGSSVVGSFLLDSFVAGSSVVAFFVAPPLMEAPRQPMPPACASIIPIPTGVPGLRPSAAAAEGPTPPPGIGTPGASTCKGRGADQCWVGR